jgi:hypothetical protein
MTPSQQAQDPAQPTVVPASEQDASAPQTAVLTPTADTTPAAAVATNELSGAQWVARFPTSVLVADCVDPFKDGLTRFLAALEAAGAVVSIAATLRPPERAYLMHWSWMISKKDYDPQTVPAMNGVNIDWVHRDTKGKYAADASKAAATAMVNGYGMQNLGTAPALNSRHTDGLAVDMSISWSGNLAIANADGTSTTIKTAPKSGMNTDLHAVGATYNVMKYVGGDKDKPHWSSDGH